VEVVRDELLVDASSRGDLGHPRTREPFGGELLDRGVKDQRLRALGIALPLVRRRRSPHRPPRLVGALLRGHEQHSAIRPDSSINYLFDNINHLYDSVTHARNYFRTSDLSPAVPAPLGGARPAADRGV